MACTRGTGLFAEALSHCRHGRRLRETISGLRVETYAGKSFEEVFGEIYSTCRTPANKYGIGKLTVYDLAAAICRHHSIQIPHVYIIGSGPKRAVKLLGLETSIQHIGDVSLHYVELSAVLNALRASSLATGDISSVAGDADTMETYLCNWQKTIATMKSSPSAPQAQQ